ncbi:glycosyl transferase family 2 [Dethiosulfovibrio peptidovorans DSM 11002]|uniref:Glycosyl transferase family 2 n=1 Tax=Dethiosulfovibrio peptidovorans DSM 11002 TaxID=469381 RepID=D2Z6I7_9BACT|nr:glycosyltransferase [Dethiosulfovibrio peptidovorans]EFC91084.1 glycosyl transferase family 2 [Dethiosulfovibrio peptidovorans DSM 11002]
MKNGIGTWIIVPCFNEGRRLNLDAFRKYLRSHEDTGFCFVDDGSQDNTWARLEPMRSGFPRQTTALHLNRNSGKAEAVRSGINFTLKRTATARYVGFWDADLATPLDEIDSFRHILRENDSFAVASGSRIRRMGASIERSVLRDLEGRVFAALASLVLGLGFRETQCGAKLFERSLAERIFQDPFISSWGFDVEIFARVLRLYGRERTKKLICEVPLRSWREIPGSKMDLAGKLRSLTDLVLIFHRYRMLPPIVTKSSPIRGTAMRSWR